MMTYSLMRQYTYTPADCVRVAAELGMEGIDWVTTYDEDPKLLRRMCDDAGLEVAAHTFFLRENDLEQLESVAARSLDDACILGAPVVMIPPLPFAGVTDPAENRRRWIGVLQKAAPLAAERNLIMTVENFPGAESALVTADDFYAIKQQVPELKLTFDNGNAATGEDQLESLQRCINDIVHVHFKDWLRSDTPQKDFRPEPMRDGRYYASALVGEGIVDSRATVKALEAAGYDGFVNIEYEADLYPAHEAVRKALAYLRA